MAIKKKMDARRFTDAIICVYPYTKAYMHTCIIDSYIHTYRAFGVSFFTYIHTYIHKSGRVKVLEKKST
jgi:hypothetical protein